MEVKTILRIEFTETFDDGETHKRIFEAHENEELTTYDLHKLMKSATESFGYSERAVENAFGETVYDD